MTQCFHIILILTLGHKLIYKLTPVLYFKTVWYREMFSATSSVFFFFKLHCKFVAVFFQMEFQLQTGQFCKGIGCLRTPCFCLSFRSHDQHHKYQLHRNTFVKTSFCVIFFHITKFNAFVFHRTS